MPLYHDLTLQGFNVKSGSADASGSITGSQVTFFTLGAFNSESIQISIPSQSLGSSEDAIPFFISKSFAPKIGIGTDTPLSTLDIVDVEDTAEGFTFLIRNARTSTEGGQLGDAAGTINFIVTSGSYNNKTT